jgi:hypothetical protein
MKQQLRGGLVMLVALVASKIEAPKDKIQFIDFKPEQKKIRKYKKS